MRQIYAGGLLALLAGCSAVAMQPADPAVQGRMTARIVQACTASGMFKLADGLVLAAVPGGPLAKTVIDSGVDIVCADPARFAGDLSTAEWVAKNLAARL